MDRKGGGARRGSSSRNASALTMHRVQVPRRAAAEAAKGDAVLPDALAAARHPLQANEEMMYPLGSVLTVAELRPRSRSGPP